MNRETTILGRIIGGCLTVLAVGVTARIVWELLTPLWSTLSGLLSLLFTFWLAKHLLLHRLSRFGR